MEYHCSFSVNVRNYWCLLNFPINLLSEELIFSIKKRHSSWSEDIFMYLSIIQVRMVLVFFFYK